MLLAGGVLPAHAYRRRGFWANDTTIELWLLLLVHTISARPQPAWIARARDDWAIQASVGFHGCVNVGLDDHLAGDSTRETESLRIDQLALQPPGFGGQQDSASPAQNYMSKA